VVPDRGRDARAHVSVVFVLHPRFACAPWRAVIRVQKRRRAGNHLGSPALVWIPESGSTKGRLSSNRRTRYRGYSACCTAAHKDGRRRKRSSSAAFLVPSDALCVCAALIVPTYFGSKGFRPNRQEKILDCDSLCYLHPQNDSLFRRKDIRSSIAANAVRLRTIGQRRLRTILKPCQKVQLSLQ
jgi:hypothetical protein